jgi:rhamnosyltransferase
MNLKITDKNKKLAIGFVTYNPGVVFYDRLSMLNNEGYPIYIFDNSPEVKKTKNYSNLINNSHFSTAGKNVGLGIGLSIITASAYYDGCENLIFFDQDTVFTFDTLKFIEFFLKIKRSEINKKFVSIVFDSKKNIDNKNFNIEKVKLAISSGSMFVLENLKKVGWHNPTYFVDCVDYELCVRSSTCGFDVGKCGSTPGFDHETEQPDYIIKIFKKRVFLRRYPAARFNNSIKAYIRLMVYTFIMNEYLLFFILLKSFLIYFFCQILARIILK